jgi:hypothetical protein
MVKARKKIFISGIKLTEARLQRQQGGRSIAGPIIRDRKE